MADEITDQIGKRIKTITTDLKRYVEKRIELMVISVGQQYAHWIAKAIHKIAGLVLLFGALVFLLIALALYLGALLHSRSLGFVLVSIPFLISGFLFLRLKPKIINQKLGKEFEEELLDVFKAGIKEESERLSARESKALEKNNKNHG